MIKINALGKPCPLPVIMTKNALKELTTGEIEITIDNEISVQNVEKLCLELGYKYNVVEEEEIYKVLISKNLEPIVNTFNVEKLEKAEENIVIVIDSDEMGKGDIELGKTLMKGFLYTLTEIEKLPKTIIFYNSGVLLGTETAETWEDIKNLSDKGVEILFCGACTNFYEITDRVRIGEITNMYNIVNKQLRASKVIKP
ncbi:MAG: sulfurtransferase-like selenium metabolism protein YedF [Fusobacteriaceae bacterium]